MTSINRPTILPPKLDLTPNCAILSKMDLKKLHQKISNNISSQNYAQTGHFSQEIKDLLQEDLKIKRSKLDKMSTRQKKKTKKFQTIAHDEENKRKQWTDFLVSSVTDTIFHETFLFYKRTLKLKYSVKIVKTLLLLASFTSWIDSCVQY